MTTPTIYLLACYFIILIAMMMRFHDVATLQSEIAILMAYDNDMYLTENRTEAMVVWRSSCLFASSRGISFKINKRMAIGPHQSLNHPTSLHSRSKKEDGPRTTGGA